MHHGTTVWFLFGFPLSSFCFILVFVFFLVTVSVSFFFLVVLIRCFFPLSCIVVYRISTFPPVILCSSILSAFSSGGFDFPFGLWFCVLEQRQKDNKCKIHGTRLGMDLVLLVQGVQLVAGSCCYCCCHCRCHCRCHCCHCRCSLLLSVLLSMFAVISTVPVVCLLPLLFLLAPLWFLTSCNTAAASVLHHYRYCCCH